MVSSKEVRLGILTDIGHVFKDLFPLVSSLDAVFIESNHDEAMLRNGRYPAFLKQRIRGPRGHLSNLEAAELLLSGGRLKWACLAHLSSNNNDPKTALRTHREILGNGLSLYTAGRHSPTEMLEVTE